MYGGLGGAPANTLLRREKTLRTDPVLQSRGSKGCAFSVSASDAAALRGGDGHALTVEKRGLGYGLGWAVGVCSVGSSKVRFMVVNVGRAFRLLGDGLL